MANIPTNITVNVLNLNQLRALEHQAISTANALTRVNAGFSNVPGGLANVEREANHVFNAIQQGAAGAGQVLRNAFAFSTAFLGFIVVNETLKTFNSLTVGSVRAAAEFEQQLAFVAKTANLTAEQTEELGKSLRIIAREAPISTTELTKAAEIAGQLGITGTSNITKFAETITKLSTATTLGVEEAATFLGRFQNITGLPTDQLENIASTVVDLGNKFASTENEISEFSLRLAGAGQVLGLEAPEIAAFGNALASVGINAEAGGTAFSRVFLAIETASIRGGTSLSNFARVAGITTEAFRELARSNPDQAVIKFIEGLEAIKASGGDVVAVLADLGLNEIRVRDALLRAASSGDLFSRSITEANIAFAQNSALGIEFARQAETTASKSQILSNNIKDLQLVLGNAFLPSLAAGSENLADFVQGLAGTEQGVSDLGDSLNNTFGILRDGGGVVAGLLGPIDKLSNSFNVLGSSINVALQALTALVLLQATSGTGRFLGGLGSNRALNLAVGGLVPQTFPTRIGALPNAFALFNASGFLRPGVDPNTLPQFDERINRGFGGFRDPGTGRVVPTAPAISQLAAAQIPQSSLRSFEALRREIGSIAAIQLTAKSAATQLISFLATPTGAFIASVAVIASLNEILERTTGEGLLEVFSTGDEKANAFKTSMEDLNRILDSFQRKVQSGEITSFGASQQGVAAVAGRQNAAIEELRRLESDLEEKQGSFGGRLAGLAAFTLGAGSSEGGLTAGIIRSITGEQKLRDNLAEIRGEIEANTSALTDFAREFNLTFTELAKQKLEIEEIGLSENGKNQLKSDFAKTFQDLAEERFAGELGTLGLIDDQNLKEAGLRARAILTDVIFTPELAEGFKAAFQEQEGGFNDFVALVNRTIDSLVREQGQKLQALLAAEPEFFTKLAEGARNVNQIAPQTLSKLNEDIQRLKAEGRPIKDLFEVSDAPKNIIEIAVALGEAANNAKIAGSPENLPLVASAIAQIGDSPEAVTVLQALVGGFADANREASEFAGTLEGLQDAISGLPSLDDALSLSPDILNKDALSHIQRFILDQQEALTGIKSPEGIFFGAGGSEKQVQAASDFGAALDQFVIAKLVEVRGLDQETFDAIRSQWTQTVDTIATSQLNIDERAEAAAQAAKLVDLFAELQKEGKVTKEIELVFEEEFEKLQARIRGEETDPLLIEVEFDIKTAELLAKLNQIAAGLQITIPVTLNGITSNVGAEQIFGPNGFISNPAITGVPTGAQREVAEASRGGGPGGVLNILDTAADTFKKLLDSAPEVVGANLDSAAKGAKDELSAFEKELIKIQKILEKLNITAQEYADLTTLTGLTADELDLLSVAFKSLGLDASELTARLKEINIRNLAKAIGVSDQALESGAFEAFLKNTLEDAFDDPKTLAAFQKLISAFATESGGRQISGLESLFGPGGGIQEQGGLAGLAAAFPNQSPETVLKLLRDAGVINFAEGGIVDRPTLAMIGELRRPEAIIPLDRFNQIFGRINGGGGNNVLGSPSNTQNTFNIIGSDASNIAQRSMNRMGRFEQIRNSRQKSVF